MPKLRFAALEIVIDLAGLDDPNDEGNHVGLYAHPGFQGMIISRGA